MRIAMVSEHASPLASVGGVDAGGQNVHVAAIACALGQLGHQVVVHTRRDDHRLATQVALAPGVVVDHIDAGPSRPVPKDDLLPYMDRFATLLEARWEHERPDVVHSHFWMSGLAALRAARHLGLPIVHNFHALGVVKRRHQGSADTSPPQRSGVERLLVAECDRVIAACSDESFELRRLGADPNRLVVIPCGVDLERFTPVGTAESTRRAYRVVVVSRLVERKGIAQVIEAVSALPSAIRDSTELVIAGGPSSVDLAGHDELRRLRNLAEALGIADRVELRGQVAPAALPGLYRSADLVVAVPWYEPFGLVPLEAMACGVPVVASAVGGLVDTVVDGLTGLHVPPRDHLRLAAAMEALLVDPARRRELGRASVARARRLYGWTRVAAMTAEAYAQLVPGAMTEQGSVLS